MKSIYKNLISKKIHKLLKKDCQKTFNVVKEIMNVELALIIKFREYDIEMIKTKDYELEYNFFDEIRMGNMEFKYGFEPFCGLPIQTPDGEMYGLLYIFEDDPQNFSSSNRKLLKKVKNIIEKQLVNIYLDVLLKELIEDIEKTRNINKDFI